MNKIKRIQIGNNVMYTKRFDEEDLRKIYFLIKSIAINEIINAKMIFSDIIERKQVKIAIREFLDGINDNN